MALYVSWPAVSHKLSFMCFWLEASFFDDGEAWELEGSLMPRVSEAGGPTGMMRDPNSTPIVTSCWWTKRPSVIRMVREDLPQPESPRETILAM